MTVLLREKTGPGGAGLHRKYGSSVDVPVGKYLELLKLHQPEEHLPVGLGSLQGRYCSARLSLPDREPQARRGATGNYAAKEIPAGGAHSLPVKSAEGTGSSPWALRRNETC